MDDATERPTPSLAAGLLLVPVVVVWAWFIQDDGFISFRYARNLALGHGLVWAPGSSEYGYTNFLYTLAMAPWIALGVPVRVASGLLTSAGFVALLGAVWTLVRDAVPDPSGRQAGIAAVTAVGVHYSVAAYASGGMETSIAAAFVAWAWVMALRASDGITWRTTLPMGLFAAGALLTRLDTCLLLAPAYAVLLATVRRHGGAAPWAAAAAIPTAAVIALLAWAYATYGQLLPTSFYAKTGHGIVVQHGISYLIAYALAEWIALGVIGWLVWQLGRRGAERTARASLLLPVGVEVAWLLYIGGDFMEFRFLVPVVALAYAWLAIQLGRAAWTGGLQVFVVGAFASTAWHGGLYSPVALRFLGVESVHFLSHWVDAPAANWTRTGKRLGERFDHGAPTTYTSR